MGFVMRSNRRFSSAGFLVCAAVFAMFSVFDAVCAQTYTVLHIFCSRELCRDGAWPRDGGLITDGTGHFFGTTGGGGNRNQGVIFEISSRGKEKVLYSFHGKKDGDFPFGGVVADSSGNFFGTTLYGGGSAHCPTGCGTVFKLSPAGSETILHAFRCRTDGCYPLAAPIVDSAGNLYGTTESGGLGGGVVFKLAPDGTETILHSFDGIDGSFPIGTIVMDKDGNLYGTAALNGTYGGGVVFKVAPDGSETTLHNFCTNCVDGNTPWGEWLWTKPEISLERPKMAERTGVE
jgi:uncharacterized repeat protein (TIGR03803 family)